MANDPKSGDINSPTDDTQNADLSPKLASLAEQAKQITADLRSAYENIHARAAAGEKITGDTFNTPENAYSEAHNSTINQAYAEMNKEATAYAQSLPGVSPVPNENPRQLGERNVQDSLMRAKAKEDELLKEMGAFDDAQFELILDDDRTLLTATKDPTPLNFAFQRQYVATAPHKNDVAGENAKTVPQLLTSLLAKNPGIAIGDVHVRSAASAMLTDNMDVLKKAGVDTLYMECDGDIFDKVKNFSAKELHELADKGHYKDVVLANADQDAKLYRVESSDNSAKSFITMLAAAKEHDIRIVDIDKRGDVRFDEITGFGVAHRIASSNFVWTDNVRKDREQLAAEGKKNGKYVLFGGLGHFTNDGSTNGMVADALGTPVIALERRDDTDLPIIRQPVSFHGADFGIPGGKNYADTENMAKAADIRSIQAVVDPLQGLPGMAQLSGWLADKEATYQNAGFDSLGLKPRVPVYQAPDSPETAPGQLPSPSTPQRSPQLNIPRR